MSTNVQTRSQWSSVLDTTPTIGEDILLKTKEGEYFIGSYFGGGMYQVVSGIELGHGGMLIRTHAQIYQSYFVGWRPLD